ncbi:hypothetical protein C0995_009835 [Termitomyces sp. Mi166|nr:hypothetical protein C0995_009835 [Termitomyces sp. Mi166\
MQLLSRARSASAPSSPKSSSPSSRSPSMAVTLNVASFISKIRQSPTRHKPNHIDSSSGEPQTHPKLSSNTYEKTGPYELKEIYICSDAVDMKLLLRLTRNTLLEHVRITELHALVDEHFKLTYIACCAQSAIPDPHQPVALEKIKSVPGLMTICDRSH